MTHRIVVIEGGKRVNPPAALPEQRVEQAAEPNVANNTEWMLSWCRAKIPGFSDMHDRALASKLVGSKAK